MLIACQARTRCVSAEGSCAKPSSGTLIPEAVHGPPLETLRAEQGLNFGGSGLAFCRQRRFYLVPVASSGARGALSGGVLLLFAVATMARPWHGFEAHLGNRSLTNLAHSVGLTSHSR